ncbi:hypothetical protein A6E01_20340 (plasmid) [Vibrio breoganii]|uniref:Uncharacterized protein n=1 Tax=Vibrio breoganii TaxID=553239 RepID=A0AAN0XZM2_9VIBR|nr:hypothetical protein [Vibrio breoganii]ANO35564.1 hypothetical protein A6E01_20340 [Vibrio breoganii]PML15827.1 hypothetical protein BCT84_07435 [Vibrio breoganii]
MKMIYQVYKEEFRFESGDPFLCYGELYTEAGFFTWLHQQACYMNFVGVLYLPFHEWDAVFEQYLSYALVEYAKTYPDGYFECISADGKKACALVPSANINEGVYMISFICSQFGPDDHLFFDSRLEALKVLAKGGWTPSPGAYDAITESDNFEQATQLRLWGMEGLMPIEGIVRDINKSSVRKLFPDTVKRIETA